MIHIQSLNELFRDKKWYQAHYKFKTGDIIYCINTTNSLKEDVPYTISTVRYNPDDDELCYISLKEDGYGGEYNEHRFLTEEEYSANKYNL